MKTKEELSTLKNEVETLNKKLAELSEEELKQVSGGLTQEEIEKFKEQSKARALDEQLNPLPAPSLNLPKTEQGIEPAEREEVSPKMDSRLHITQEAQNVVNYPTL